MKVLLFYIRKGILTFFALTVFVGFTSFSANIYPELVLENQIQNFSKKLPYLQGWMKADSARTIATNKVAGFIEKYNKEMPAHEKLAVANEIYEMSLKYNNLDVDLICATITHESAFTWRKNITSPAGALGLMQIMPETGRYLSAEEGINWTSAHEILYNPILNIRLGCRYLSRLIELYHLDGGLAAYNGGESRAAKWLASGRDNTVLFEETRDYVPSILKLYDTYKN